MKNRGLAFKLSVSILSVTIVIFTLMFLYNYFVSRELILRSVEENTRNLTSSAINKSEGFFSAIEKIAYNFSFVVRADTADREGNEKLLQDIVMNNDEIYGSCIAFAPLIRSHDTLYDAPYYFKKDNQLQYVDLSLPSYFYPNWEWYRLPKAMHMPIWSEPYFDEGGGEEIMATYSVPFYLRPGDTTSFAGVITADVSLQWLSDIVSGIKIFTSGYAFLISRDGTIITHPESKYVMKESILSLADSFEDEKLKSIGQDMLQGKEGFVEAPEGFFAEKSWIYYTRLDNNDWSLAFVFPEAELYAELHQLNRQLIMMAVAGLVILLSLIILIAGRITRPVRKLVAAANQIGQGKFNVAFTGKAGKDEVGQLQLSFIKMQEELRSYIQSLDSAIAAREKVESELKVARDIQMGMIPSQYPALPTCPYLDVYGFMEPAKTVGGDLFDYFLIDSKHLFFAMGDVSGKGIPASLFMAVTQTALRAGARVSGLKLEEIMLFVSTYLSQNNPHNFFVTLLAGILDLESGRMSFVNFGHCPPLVRMANGKIVRIEPLSGLPLGIRELSALAPFELVLHEGETLVTYTDGITEALDKRDRFYTEGAVIQTLGRTKGDGSREIVEDLVQSVTDFAGGRDQQDDIAVLAIRYLGNSQILNTPLKLEISNNIEDLTGLQQKIRTALEKKVPPFFFERLELVMEEILTNTIKYGYLDDAVHSIQILFEINEEGVVVEITDDARAFDPTLNRAPDINSEEPGGRGLLLVQALAGDLEYKRSDQKNHLRFKMSFSK